jgi:hypothetical protein
VLFVVATLAATTVQAAPQPETYQAAAPTYRIFATREGLVGYTTANGHVIKPRDRFVALPDWDVLSPYQTHIFQVRVTYKGRSVVLPVWDVGPWNTQDNYWDTNRKYSDLPVGRPMAHAAYYDGYNGGRDERGRKINNPNGIDIADGAFWDDLGMTRNDYVEVSFLWLGPDPGPGAAQEPAPAPPAEEPEPEPEPVDVEAGAIAIDNGGSGYNANDGTWYQARCGMGGSHDWTYSTTDTNAAENLAAWTVTLPQPDFYEVKAYIPACGNVAATTAAIYRITHDGAVTEVKVDQAASSGSWVSLGTYHFGGESIPIVELSDVAGDKARAVRFDAMSWGRRTDTTPPNGAITQIARKDKGYTLTLGGTDDLSGIAEYDIQYRQLPKGGWTNWKRAVTDHQVWFGPDEGRHFEFRVRARDWAGNEEQWPETADASTQEVAQ